MEWLIVIVFCISLLGLMVVGTDKLPFSKWYLSVFLLIGGYIAWLVMT